MRSEPHPRFYSDIAGYVPIAVPALVTDRLVADDVLYRF